MEDLVLKDHDIEGVGDAREKFTFLMLFLEGHNSAGNVLDGFSSKICLDIFQEKCLYIWK